MARLHTLLLGHACGSRRLVAVYSQTTPCPLPAAVAALQEKLGGAVKVTSRETPGATFTGIPGLGKQLISTKRTSPMAKCVFLCVCHGRRCCAYVGT